MMWGAGWQSCQPAGREAGGQGGARHQGGGTAVLCSPERFRVLPAPLPTFAKKTASMSGMTSCSAPVVSITITCGEEQSSGGA